MSRGVVYVAWGKEHIAEAVYSSQFGTDHKTLITNEPVEGFNGDVIVRELPETRNLYMRRWVGVLWTPYDQTCLLDTDCIIHGSLDLGFDLAEKFGYANVVAPGGEFHWEDKTYIHYAGAIHFFAAGYLDQLYHLMLKFTERGDTDSDEVGLSVCLRELGINPAVLPMAYCVVRSGRVHDRRAHVTHSNLLQFNTISSDAFGNDFVVWGNDVRI